MNILVEKRLGANSRVLIHGQWRVRFEHRTPCNLFGSMFLIPTVRVLDWKKHYYHMEALFFKFSLGVWVQKY